MELSYYIKIYPCSEDPDQVILFSTKQASKVQIHKELMDELKRFVSPEAADVLTPLGMAVPDREAEIREMTDYFKQRVANNKAVEYTILLNLDCNFDCPYCFEKDLKNKAYMTPDTARRLVEYIKNTLKASNKNLLVDFYGGEPLLSLPLLSDMAQQFQQISQDMGRNFSFRLVTNGALLTRNVAEKLLPLGLTGIKTTLDGPPDNHNRSRPFKSGAESFDIILENIKATWDLIKIEIGGNYDAANFKDFVGLLDILEKSGLTPETLYMVKFDPIFQFTEDRRSGKKSNIGCQTLNEPWIAEADRLLRSEILKRGYNTPKPSPLCCMIENPDSLVVNTNGDFYKCPCFIGLEEFCVGHMGTGITDYRLQYGLDVWKSSECLNCEYLPLCFGGCRHMTYMQTGKIDGVSCQKKLLDANLETIIMQDIMLRDN